MAHRKLHGFPYQPEIFAEFGLQGFNAHRFHERMVVTSSYSVKVTRFLHEDGHHLSSLLHESDAAIEIRWAIIR